MAISGLTPPTFLEGRLKEEFLPEYDAKAEGNTNFKFEGEDSLGVLKGSNVFIAGLSNKVLEDSRFRVAVPTDNIYETIFPMIKDRFYTDFNALDVKEKKPSYKRNQGIWEQAIGLAEENKGSVKFPFRIQGFYCIPNEDEEGYGVRIVPDKNFRVIEDDRLFSSRTGFNSLDKLGMINPLNEGEKGRFELYPLNNGVSGVFLSESGDLYSEDYNLNCSNGSGRVAVVGR